MSIEEGMNQLSEMFKGKDWFYDIGTDQYGRLVVYVKYMCHENLHDVPDKAGGIQVLVHFAASKLASREQFVDNGVPKRPYDTDIDTSAVVLDDVIDAEDEKSLLHLQNELDRLEKICGSNMLQDIFYEIQDGKNAVTNLSARFPEVRKGLEKLFQVYGFDVIYEELDG